MYNRTDATLLWPSRSSTLWLPTVLATSTTPIVVPTAPTLRGSSTASTTSTTSVRPSSTRHTTLLDTTAESHNVSDVITQSNMHSLSYPSSSESIQDITVQHTDLDLNSLSISTSISTSVSSSVSSSNLSSNSPSNSPSTAPTASSSQTPRSVLTIRTVASTTHLTVVRSTVTLLPPSTITLESATVAFVITAPDTTMTTDYVVTTSVPVTADCTTDTDSALFTYTTDGDYYTNYILKGAVDLTDLHSIANPLYGHRDANGKTHSNKATVIGASVGASVGALLCAVIVFILWRCRRKRNRDVAHSREVYSNPFQQSSETVRRAFVPPPVPSRCFKPAQAEAENGRPKNGMKTTSDNAGTIRTEKEDTSEVEKQTAGLGFEIKNSVNADSEEQYGTEQGLQMEGQSEKNSTQTSGTAGEAAALAPPFVPRHRRMSTLDELPEEEWDVEDSRKPGGTCSDSCKPNIPVPMFQFADEDDLDSEDELESRLERYRVLRAKKLGIPPIGSTSEEYGDAELTASPGGSSVSSFSTESLSGDEI